MPRPALATHGALALIMALFATAMACSKNSSTPSSPSGSTGSSSAGGTCRTYTTGASVTTTALGVTTNANLTGAFNTATNQSTVTTLFTNGTACTTTVSAYRSTADFVDEVKVIPPLSMQNTATTTSAAACGAAGTATVTFTYDSQRRLTSTNGVGGTTTYTAWDSSGRPTAGSFPGATITNVYNDPARTLTQTQTSGAGTSVSTITYDANGNQVSIVNTTGPVVVTTTFNVTSTAQVCK